MLHLQCESEGPTHHRPAVGGCFVRRCQSAYDLAKSTVDASGCGDHTKEANSKLGADEEDEGMANQTGKGHQPFT